MINNKFLTSISKSHSGDGERSAFVADVDDANGSSGITANRPLCKHGDGGPYA